MFFVVVAFEFVAWISYGRAWVYTEGLGWSCEEGGVPSGLGCVQKCIMWFCNAVLTKP